MRFLYIFLFYMQHDLHAYSVIEPQLAVAVWVSPLDSMIAVDYSKLESRV
jgi:hypothetical protein